MIILEHSEMEIISGAVRENRGKVLKRPMESRLPEQHYPLKQLKSGTIQRATKNPELRTDIHLPTVVRQFYLSHIFISV